LTNKGIISKLWDWI